MPSATHEAGINQVLEDFPTASRGGFGTALREIFLRQRAIPPRPHFIPDAFMVDTAKRIVVCFEVEVTNQVSDDKLEHYQDLWWFLDDVYWGLRLVVVDRYGNYAAEIDVVQLVAKSIEAEARANPAPIDPDWKGDYALDNTD